MRQALLQPLKLHAALLAALSIVVGVALYCLTYTALAGGAESFGQSVVWAAVNVLPWFLAFECGKRARDWRGKAAVLLAALLLSLALSFLPGGGLTFELVRRLPSLAIVAVLLWLGSLLARKAALPATAQLPLLPSQIDWVSAAGNYVELHGCGRTILVRSSLAAVADQLAPCGFVRVHRSRLVRRDRIVRVRQADVLLHDGTSIRIGKRYRSAI
jgi:hypothetical protein